MSCLKGINKGSHLRFLMPVHLIAGLGYDSNIYLITGDDPFLVDTGTGMHTRKVVERITELLSGSKLDRIVLTHRHFDHIGGTAEVASIFGAKVFAHEIDAPSIEQGDGRSTAADMFGCKLKDQKIEHLKDGDMISTGQCDFKVVHTPGHTSGSICLFNDEGGILISGDTVFVGGVGRWDLPTGNHEELVGSVKTLLSMKPKDIYPGHGGYGQGNATDIVKEALQMLGEF